MNGPKYVALSTPLPPFSLLLPNAPKEWLIRKHGDFEINRKEMGSSDKDQTSHYETSQVSNNCQWPGLTGVSEEVMTPRKRVC